MRRCDCDSDTGVDTPSCRPHRAGLGRLQRPTVCDVSPHDCDAFTLEPEVDLLSHLLELSPPLSDCHRH